MARCEIHATPAPTDRHAGVGYAVTWCQTHGMQVVSPQTQALCPLGRIEEATDQAIDRISKGVIKAMLLIDAAK
jgi:hypothetical protein